MASLNHANNLCLVTLPSPSTSAESAELQSKLQALEKVKELCEFHENSNNQQNDPKNFLENLCDGLQTFLGYDKTSKGYDGTGIVYSDLDRLCDGVMGFLKGVLESVKTEDAVTTYDKKDTESSLNSVLTKLQSSIGSGRNGLVESVTEVKGWLEGYEGEVREKMNAVKEPIESMKNLVEHDKNEIKIEKDKNLITQVEEWTGRAKHYVSLADQAEKALKNIDPALSGKLIKNISLLVQATKTFEAAAENGDLKDVYEEAGKRMMKVIGQIERMLENRSAGLQGYLKREIADLHGRLFKLQSKQFTDLKESVYNKLQNTVNAVEIDIAELARRYGNDVVGGVTGILGKANSLRKMIIEEKSALNEQVSSLAKRMLALKEIERDLKKKVPTELSGYQDHSNGWYLQEIGDLKQEIQNQLKRFVTTKMGAHISEVLKGITDAIANNEGDNGLLDDIVAGVGSYTGKFDITFREAIGCMVEKILEETGSEMSSKFREYAITASGSGTSSRIAAIKEAIKRHIKSIRTDKSPNSNGEAHKTLSSIQEYIGSFALAVKSKIGDIDEFISAMKKNTIVSADGVTINLPADDGNLRLCLKTILAAVQSAAEGAKNEIKRFIDTSQISKLETAILNVTGLPYSLSNKIKAAGPGSVSDLGPLGAKINGELCSAATDTKEVNTELATLIHDAVEKGIGKLQDEVAKIVGGSLPEVKNTLEGIKKELTKLQTVPGVLGVETGANHGASALEKQVYDFYNDIDRFLKTTVGVDAREKGSVHKELKDLQKDLESLVLALKNVQTNVTAVRDELTNCITQTHKLYEEAPKTTEKVFTQLRYDVEAKIDKGFRDVQQKAKDLYTARKQNEVAALQTIVDAQIDELNLIIEIDKELGVKGYLKRLNKKFMPPLSSFTQTLSPPQSPEKKLSDFAPIVKKAFDDFFRDLQKQGDLTILSVTFAQMNNALETLLSPLTHFNRSFTTHLDRLTEEVDRFRHLVLANNAQKVSLSLVPGLSAFVKELEKAYVSVYDGHQDYINFNKLFDPPINVSSNVNQKYELTDAGRKLSKVCLTIFTILQNSLKNFTVYCNQNWRLQKINKATELGSFLAAQGFTVSDKDEQNGELRNHTGMQGHKIYKLLVGNDYQHIYNSDEAHEYPLAKLNACLTYYYHVCHISTFTAKTRPCNVFEMLCWLCGFPCNSSYSTLVDAALTDLFEGPAKQIGDDEEITATFVGDVKLEAFPQSIKYDDARRAVAHICSISYDVLTTIVGTGDAQTMYAVDFCTNSLSFHYPSDPSGCFDALIDILRRLFPVFQFLRVQCNLSTKHGGWRECQYGKDIFTTISQCNEHSTHEVKCRPTSPLMSYLHDCLPGWLPHGPTAIGCKNQCNACLKSTPGMPCLTPLGFRGFSGSTKTGRNICDIFDRFFTNSYLGALLCLVPKPPSTLPEHFGFTLSLMKAIGISTAQKTRADVITLENVLFKSIAEQSINLYTEHSKLTQALTNAYGSPHPKHGECKYAHLRNLTAADSCKGKTNPGLECAPYLSTLCRHSYRYLAIKHSNAYLSWLVYLPWNFWNLLKNLYDAFCNVNCHDWGCRGCLQKDKCKKGKHGHSDTNAENIRKSYCQCTSIVQCKGVSPTLYRYGFSFQDASSLNHDTYPNTCTDFCSQLDKVLTSDYFRELFKECDNFLWQIRLQFSYLVLALWSLSLFYLICVMVGRLDVLHVRSHLRSPSSHRITAQSLLAAAQVGRLAKISYLQP